MNEMGISLDFDESYKKIRDDFADKFFNGNAENTCIFAFSLGVLKEERIPRKMWKSTATSWSDMNRIRGKGINLEIIIDSMDLAEEEVSIARIISEYVTGGLKVIDDDLLVEDGSFAELQNYLNHRLS